jgi:hypothetical protein
MHIPFPRTTHWLKDISHKTTPYEDQSQAHYRARRYTYNSGYRIYATYAVAAVWYCPLAAVPELFGGENASPILLARPLLQIVGL